MTSAFADWQVDQLLKPIHPSRVAKDPKGMAYVEQHEIRAHLTRIFGFGNWDMEVTRLNLVFEQTTVVKDKQTGQPKPDRWDAAYSASVKVSVKGCGTVGGRVTVCSYEDAATGDAQNQTRAEAHDLALKTAVSTALKRAATCLGDQYGLGLYAKGSTSALVKAVLQEPTNEAAQEELRAVCVVKGITLEAAEETYLQSSGKHVRDSSNEEIRAFIASLGSESA